VEIKAQVRNSFKVDVHVEAEVKAVVGVDVISNLKSNSE
jgi:hypothetical protein